MRMLDKKTEARGVSSRVLLVLAACTSGCVEDGFVPDCPEQEEFLDQDGALDFDAWRSTAEAQGCMTPIGGFGGHSSSGGHSGSGEHSGSGGHGGGAP